MTGNIYSETVENEYLGVKEEIMGSNLLEHKIRVEDRLARWAEKEKMQRALDSIAWEKDLVEEQDRQLRREIEEYKNILNNALKTGSAVNWVDLYDDKPFEPFVFHEVAPSYNKIAQELALPEKSYLEIFLPSLKSKRLNLQKESQKIFSERVRLFEERKAAALKAYEDARARYTERQSELNDTIEKLRFDYETGKLHGIEGYLRIVLLKSVYPDNVKKDFDVFFDEATKTAVVNYLLPDLADLPQAGDIKNVQADSTEGTENIEFYRNIQVQIALRTIYEIFAADYKKYIKNAGFNGWLISSENSGDKEYSWCYVTFKVSRENFDQAGLQNSPPETVFHALGGVAAQSLAMGDAVEPLINVVFGKDSISPTLKT